jgi:hypothetical protein
MKWFAIITTVLCLSAWTGCEKKLISPLSCNTFELNKPFTAKISQDWCLEGSDLKITFGPFIEDSRCNVEGIECIWAGRYVMGATIDNGEPYQDTFYAVNNWTDTLYHGPYQIILTKVYPEMRATMEPLAPALYSFDILVK